MASGLPELTPPWISAGRCQTVVIEFPRELPQDVLITLDFFYEGTVKKAADTVPIVRLGPNTVKAKFPEFSRPGEVEVVVKLAREESSIFPRFKVRVQDPINAIYHSVPSRRGSDQKALLAALFAYLMHDDKDKDMDTRSHADMILSDLLKTTIREIPDWNLAAFLCGVYGSDENLLHFCLRRRLDGMADFLLQEKQIAGRAYCLQQKSSDGKSPAELAKKSGMKRISDKLESLLAGPGGRRGSGSVSQDQERKKKAKVKRTKSGEPRHAVIKPEEADIGPLPLYVHKQGRPKRKLARRLKSVFTGDRERELHVISPPHLEPHLESETVTWQATEREPDRDKPYPLPRSHTIDVMYRLSLATGTQRGSTLPPAVATSGIDREAEPYLLPKGDAIHQQHATSPATRAEANAAEPASVHVPSQYSLVTSSPGYISVPTDTARLSMTSGEATSGDTYVSTSNHTAAAYGTAVSTAISGLKRKCLYTAVVVEWYRWSSSPYGDFILRVGDIVYVTQEVEGEMCLGICNDCYGKFPLDILRHLTKEEEERIGIKVEAAGSDSEELPQARGWYQSPTNNQAAYISEDDSDSDHLYEYPPEEELEFYRRELAKEPEVHYNRVPQRSPALRPQISTHKLSATPGRLLSGFVNSSSYDTGLDRLGMPRHISKVEPPLSIVKDKPVAIARAIAAEGSEHVQGSPETVAQLEDVGGSDPCVPPTLSQPITSPGKEGNDAQTKAVKTAVEHGSTQTSAREKAEGGENHDDVAPRRQPQSPEDQKSEAESNQSQEDGSTKSLPDSKAETAKSVETTNMSGQTTPKGSPIPAPRHLPSATSPSPGPIPKPRPRSQISAASAASRLTPPAKRKAQNYSNTEKEKDSNDSEAAPGFPQTHHLERKDATTEQVQKPKPPPISPKPDRKITFIIPNSNAETDANNTEPDKN